MHVALKCQPRFSAFLALGLAFALSVPGGDVKAGPLLSLTVNSSTTAIGTNGSFEISLSNDALATSSAFVNEFSVDVAVPVGSGIVFIGANETTTDPFIFGNNHQGLSLFGPANEVTGTDLAFNVSHRIFPGDKVGLFNVKYFVFPSASSTPITVSILNVGTFTTLTDDGIPPQSLVFTAVNGSINITGISGNPVPEPSTLLLVATAIVVGAGFWRSRRQSAKV